MAVYRVSVATVYTYDIEASGSEEAEGRALGLYDAEDPLDRYDPTVLGCEEIDSDTPVDP